MHEDYINKKTEGNKLETILEVNGVKLEIGPDLGDFLWNEISTKLAEMNNQCKEGEESWRTMTADEFKEIGKEINKLWKEPGRNNREAVISEMVKRLGFKPDHSYWAGSCYDDGQDKTNVWSSRTGEINYASKKTNAKAGVSFVRGVKG